MSWYVKRQRVEGSCPTGVGYATCRCRPSCDRLETGGEFGRVRTGWVGPVKSERQADREVAAWQSDGWKASKHVSTPEIRTEVNAWQRAAREGRRSR